MNTFKEMDTTVLTLMNVLKKLMNVRRTLSAQIPFRATTVLALTDTTEMVHFLLKNDIRKTDL